MKCDNCDVREECGYFSDTIEPIQKAIIFSESDKEEINDNIRQRFNQILNSSKPPTSRDLEIEDILRKEKEEYEVARKEFYDNPIHWDNNKRRRYKLPVVRGKANKHRSKKYHCFIPTSKVFFLIEDIIEETLKDNLNNDKWFEKFVDVKDLNLGDRDSVFYTEE